MKNQLEEISVSEITILVERKNIKNMYLRVHASDGTVKMTVPKRTSAEMIRRFALSKMEWIRRAQTKFANRPQPTIAEYQSGEVHLLWGKEYILKIISGRAASVQVEENYIVIKVSGSVTETTSEQRKILLDEFYRNQLKTAILSVLPKCVSIVGKSPKEWRVKNMKTRWGTCNVKEKRIWLNLQLAKKPPECLEYVIIHELVHLYEREHNSRFWNYMDQFYPDWRGVKKRLNDT